MDNNMQRGGNNNSRLITFLFCFYSCVWGWASNNKTNFCRYEMIFDEDIPESPRQEKKNGHHDLERQKMHRRSLEDIKQEEEKKYPVEEEGKKEKKEKEGEKV